MTPVLEQLREEFEQAIAARHRAEQEKETPEKLPPQSPSQPGPVYENPNEDETYSPPEEDGAGSDKDDSRR